MGSAGKGEPPATPNPPGGPGEAVVSASSARHEDLRT